MSTNSNSVFPATFGTITALQKVFLRNTGIYIAICLFCILSPLKGQEKSIDELMKLRPTGTGTFSNKPYPGVIYLPMPFSKAEFTDVTGLKLIPDSGRIYMVALVYTRYHEADTFNQPELNRERFARLKEIYPGAFLNPAIEWKVLEQRDATEREPASKCFHGFAIYLRNDPPPSLIERDIKTITRVLDSYHDTLIWIPEKIEYKIKKVKIETGKYLPNSKAKRRGGMKYDGPGIWFREKEYKIRRDSTVRKRSGGYYSKIYGFDSSMFKSTWEFHALTRRKWSKNMCVVTDVTGSMSPYAAEFMLWLKYSPHILQQGRFVFFNDGDAKPDILKRTGNTGGIHFAATNNYDSVLAVMTQTMRMGTGGDLPENNIEASLAALKTWPDTDTVLLIADNNAAVKDLILLKDLKKPVSVMLCGVVNKIHPDYISLTSATGGRLFVMDQELEELKKTKNGDKKVIGGREWEFRNGTYSIKP